MMRLKSVNMPKGGLIGPLGKLGPYHLQASDSLRLEMRPDGMVFVKSKTEDGWATLAFHLASYEHAFVTLDGEPGPEQLDLHQGKRRR